MRGKNPYKILQPNINNDPSLRAGSVHGSANQPETRLREAENRVRILSAWCLMHMCACVAVCFLYCTHNSI